MKIVAAVSGIEQFEFQSVLTWSYGCLPYKFQIGRGCIAIFGYDAAAEGSDKAVADQFITGEKEIAVEVGFKPPENVYRYGHIVLKLIAITALFIRRQVFQRNLIPYQGRVGVS